VNSNVIASKAKQSRLSGCRNPEAWIASLSLAMTANRDAIQEDRALRRAARFYDWRGCFFSPPNRLAKKSTKLRSFGATWRRLTTSPRDASASRRLSFALPTFRGTLRDGRGQRPRLQSQH